MEDRIVILIDMDCFYVQVEERDYPHIKGVPAAVVQYNTWKGGGIIAVNYEARACGVKRGMRGEDAKEKCPNIQLVQVPILRDKADLTKYRNAGKEVVSVLCEFSDCVERASIDEAYIDFTKSIEDIWKRRQERETLVSLNDLPGTWVVGYDNLDDSDLDKEVVRSSGISRWFKDCGVDETDEIPCEDFESNVRPEEIKLAVAAKLCEEMRLAVLRKTGFKCSAGISSNKMLAKLACGLHKPNQQSVMPTRLVPLLWSRTPVGKVRNLGGKLGESLTDDFGCETMSDLSRLSLKQLKARYDDKTARWLFSLGQGIDSEAVKPRQLPKSVGCGKNFSGREGLDTTDKVKDWVGKLSEELQDRLIEDRNSNGRVAKTLTVSVRNDRFSFTKSSSCPAYDRDKIGRVVFSLIKKGQSAEKQDTRTPIVRNISLSAGKFENCGSAKDKRIDAMFKEINNSMDINISSTHSKGDNASTSSAFYDNSQIFSSSRSKNLASESPFENDNKSIFQRSISTTPLPKNKACASVSSFKSSKLKAFFDQQTATQRCLSPQMFDLDESNNCIEEKFESNEYETDTDEDDISEGIDSHIENSDHVSSLSNVDNERKELSNLPDTKFQHLNESLPNSTKLTSPQVHTPSAHSQEKSKSKKRSVLSPNFNKKRKRTPKGKQPPKNSFFLKFMANKSCKVDTPENEVESTSTEDVSKTSNNSFKNGLDENSTVPDDLTNKDQSHNEFSEPASSNHSETHNNNNNNNSSESTISIHELFPDLENIDPSVIDILPDDLKKQVRIEMNKLLVKDSKLKSNFNEVNNPNLQSKRNCENDNKATFKSHLPTTDGGTYDFCKECNRRILKSNMIEHNDYHFAMDLRKQQLSERSISISKKVSKTKNSKSKNGTNSQKNSRTIDSFYKPKPNS